MLHNHIYNHALTEDLLTAFRERDVSYITQQMLIAASELANMNSNDPGFHTTASRLHICTGMFSFYADGGSSVSLMTDFINL